MQRIRELLDAALLILAGTALCVGGLAVILITQPWFWIAVIAITLITQ
jgi:energy-converting hydrogenase Eha subunit C